MVTNIQKKLFFLLGIFCTFIALKFGNGAALFNYIILLIIIVQILFNRKIYLYKYKLPIYLFIIMMPISIIINLANINKATMVDGLGITIKFIILILPFIVLFSDKEICLYREKFFKGLYIGSWIQLIWGNMQIILFHTNKVLLNQIIFGNLLHINLKDVNWANYTGVGIRPTGIGWETAVYAISLLFGFIYTNRLYFKVLFGFSILLSTSGTGIITLVIVIIYEIIMNRKLIKNKIISMIKNIKRLFYKNNYSFKKIILIILISAAVITFIIYNKKNIYNIIISFVSYINMSVCRIIRIISGKNNNEISTSIHMLYYKKIFHVLFSGNIIQSLFGYGNFIVGRLYSSMYGLYSYSVSAWNPESDFVTILLGTGILGLGLYYYLIYKAFIICKEKQFKKYLIVILISGISYLFIRGTYTFLIIIFLIANEEKNNSIIKTNKHLPIKLYIFK